MNRSRIVALSVLILVTMLACSAVSNILATPTPPPTSTPLPTFTPVPASGSILLEETTFSRAGCFSFDDTSDVKRYEENGQLHMDVITPGLLAWTLCENHTFTDFVVEVDATQVGGVDDNAYGLVFRYDVANDEYYVFAISGDGYYVFALDGINKETPEILLDWTESAAIKQGNQTNHLKVVAVGGKFKLYVNGQYLAEVEDDRLGPGMVGLFVLASDNGSSHIFFDNLLVTKP